MSVLFVEGRKVPASIRQADGVGRYGRYGDTGSDIANIVEKASPFDFLKGVFVDKPAAAAANQAAIAEAQAQAAAMMQGQQQDTMRTVAFVGAGIVALIVVASILRRPRAVAGYRRSRRSRSRR